MSPQDHIAEALAILTDAKGENWDADDGMPLDRVLTSPLGRAMRRIHDADRGALEWICFFVARRALACWDMSCGDLRPREMVRLIGEHLLDRRTSLDEPCTLIRSPHRDCRYSDTQGAADSVAHAARYVRDGMAPDSIFCVSGADLAYTHRSSEFGLRATHLEPTIGDQGASPT